MQYMLMLKIYKHISFIVYCALFQNYILVFGIAHVPEYSTRGIEDAIDSLATTLVLLQVTLDREAI